MNFKQFLEEKTEKHAVLAFGRMNPPTTGHAKLVDAVKDVAKKVNGSHHIVISHSQDPKKNPLTAEQKLKHAKRYFPDTNLSTSDKQHPNFLSQASKLHSQGVTHLHMVAGSDRTGEYHKLLHQYNGVKGTHGYFKFRGIEVHSAGERDPDSEGVEGMSASKMREHALKGNFKEFKKGVPSHVAHEHAKELYNDVRKGMNIKENFESILSMILAEGVHDKGIFKAVFLSGGPGSGKDYVLDNTLAGHGLVEINSDKALEFLMDKNNLDKKMPESEKEARDLIRGKAKDMTELKQRLALLGRNGLIINGTGDDPEKYAKIKKNLESIGYETHMVAVVTRDEVSAQRNIERGQRGGRTVPEEIRKQKWDAVNNARPEMAKLFGNNYVEFDNSEDLRNAPPEVVKQKKEEMLNIFKRVKDFVEAPPKNDDAKQWVAGELAKKDTLSVPKAGVEMTPPPSHQEQGGPAEEANRLGLKYYGFGRYGKNGKVTHHSVHGQLVQDPVHAERQKAEQKAAKVRSVAASGSPVTKPKENAPFPFKESADMDFEFENFLQEAVTISVTADTPEELKHAFQMLTGNGDNEAVEESTLSDNGALNALTLGTKVSVYESYSGQKSVKHTDGNTYIAANGKPRIYAIRNNAAKDAHRKNGEVVKTDKGYMVKLKESTNVEISKEFIKEESGGTYTSPAGSSSAGTITIGEQCDTCADTEAGDTCGSCAAETGTSKAKTAAPKKKLILSQIKEQFKQKIDEIDRGIEPGMALNSYSKEKLDKNGKVTVAELTGDETTASIGDKKEDEMKKVGISLSTFKKRNYV